MSDDKNERHPIMIETIRIDRDDGSVVVPVKDIISVQSVSNYVDDEYALELTVKGHEPYRFPATSFWVHAMFDVLSDAVKANKEGR